jgi:hypothetical protein
MGKVLEQMRATFAPIAVELRPLFSGGDPAGLALKAARAALAAWAVEFGEEAGLRDRPSSKNSSESAPASASGVISRRRKTSDVSTRDRPIS